MPGFMSGGGPSSSKPAKGTGKPPKGGPTSASQAADYEASAKNLLAHMDRYGVAKALLMPPPRTRDNMARDEVTELAGVVKRHPSRFCLVAGGDVLNPMIHACEPSRVTADVRAQFEKEAERLVKSGVKAFGEMAGTHLSFKSDHPFEGASPDHPLFLLLAEIAARHNVPIDFHTEAVPADIPLPAGFDRVSQSNPTTLKATIPGLVRLLAHNRNARIVWQHIGWDNTGHMTVELLRRLLTAHPNLFLALRVEERPFTMGGSPMPNRIVDRDWRIRAEWRKLFEEFPDRFVVGTDEFFAGTDRSGRSPQSFEETWCILDQLAPELAARIGRQNAARIYNVP
jgi:predicted TIM-barrel fold metal-dependent hydrolase